MPESFFFKLQTEDSDFIVFLNEMENTFKFYYVKVGIHLYNLAYNLNCRKYLKNFSNVYPLIQFLKGNPNFQGILDCMLQILHYYCRKQHKNIENSRIIEQNLVLSLPFSLFTATYASFHLPQGQSFFIS